MQSSFILLSPKIPLAPLRTLSNFTDVQLLPLLLSPLQTPPPPTPTLPPSSNVPLQSPNPQPLRRRRSRRHLPMPALAVRRRRRPGHPRALPPLQSRARRSLRRAFGGPVGAGGMRCEVRRGSSEGARVFVSVWVWDGWRVEDEEVSSRGAPSFC